MLRMAESVAAGLAMKKPPSTCTGCGQPILDQYILRVAPDLEWHAGCLRCSECHTRLDETSHCYVKQERIYCKNDYQRLFGTKCPKCQLTIGEQDYVMKAGGQQAYHTDCFICSVCNKRLTKGDMYYMTNSGSILCKADRDAGRQLTLQHQQKPLPAGTSSRDQTAGGRLLTSAQDSISTSKGGSASASGSSTSSSPDSTIPPTNLESASKASSLSEAAASSDKPHTKSKKKKTSDKPARVRTVLTEKQLHTLRTCYAANPRPDALMKEQLCELTGLTPRVIRVWFQNKRCKDKKKAMMTQRHVDAGVEGPMIIPLSMEQHCLMRLPGTEGSVLPPLPSIPTIPAPGTPSTPGPLNVLPVLSSCSTQPGFQGMPQHQPHYGEPHTPTTPVTGQMFGHLGSPPPPPLPPLSQHFPTEMPPMYRQLQTIKTAPHQQPVGYPMPWQCQVNYPQMDEPPPLYPPHSSVL